MPQSRNERNPQRSLCRLIGVSLFFCSLAFSSPDQKNCRALARDVGCYACTAPVAWKYCIDGAASRPVPVVYFFHGRDGSELAWRNTTRHLPELIRERWNEKKVQLTVVSVSLGPGWYLHDETLAYFSGPALDEIDQRIPSPRSRSLLGLSMGAFNALQVAARAPVRFRKVALVCPALLKGFSPVSKENDLGALASKEGADPKRVIDLARKMKESFPTLDQWRKASPEHLISLMTQAGAPHFYVSSGIGDELGGYSGARAFTDKARERGIPVSWRPLHGGHCVADAVSLADFLAD